MQITEIRAEFRKTVSDGSYGNETASVTLVAQVQAGENTAAVQAALANQARDEVLRQLRASHNAEIARALETPEEREARRAREREELEIRRRKWEAERLEREARLAQGASAGALDLEGDGDEDDTDTDDEDDEGDFDHSATHFSSPSR